jgi:hypothetical protein
MVVANMRGEEGGVVVASGRSMLITLELPRELDVKEIYTSNGQREAQRMASIGNQRGEGTPTKYMPIPARLLEIEILYQIITPMVESLLSQLQYRILY